MVAHAREALERQPCAPRSVAHGAPLERGAQHLRAVTSLEAHAAAHAGARIHDEAESLHEVVGMGPPNRDASRQRRFLPPRRWRAFDALEDEAAAVLARPELAPREVAAAGRMVM